MRGWAGPLVDAVHVARFELHRALRARRVLAVVLVAALAHIGATLVFVEVLSRVEGEVADQLAVARTRYPGTLMAKVRESEQLRPVLGGLVGDASVDAVLLWSPLAVFALWFAIGVMPFVAATTASEAVAVDLPTRTLRFEALRVPRAELVAGRFLGQVLLVGLAQAVALVAVWATVMATMTAIDAAELAAHLALLGGRGALFCLPFVGLGLATSQLANAPGLARVGALLGTGAMWALYGLLRAAESAPWTWLADGLLPLLPASWIGALWRGGEELWLASGVLVALAVLGVGVGFLRMAGRDL